MFWIESDIETIDGAFDGDDPHGWRNRAWALRRVFLAHHDCWVARQQYEACYRKIKELS